MKLTALIVDDELDQYLTNDHENASYMDDVSIDTS